MMRRIAYISLGSNLGDRSQNIQQAIDYLYACPQVKILKISSLYKTEPWGPHKDQPEFLNAVIKLQTDLGPEALHRYLQEIEYKLHRKRNKKGGPRTIDLDILFFGKILIDDENLKVPHPEIANRAFVLIPLAEIAPKLYHPVLKKTIATLLSELKARARTASKKGEPFHMEKVQKIGKIKV
ncbi:MAG: 2-amino-4-hydroxy-6-hydroxymethyldihydropteridine diphosphokinase [bacterium]|nr:2-amino-4-hydroxy-6-hydroxymethyldihydropteridine diphosphokinase [bacterium]